MKKYFLLLMLTLGAASSYTQSETPAKTNDTILFANQQWGTCLSTSETLTLMQNRERLISITMTNCSTIMANKAGNWYQLLHWLVQILSTAEFYQ